MKSFGYSIHPDRQVDYDRNDKRTVSLVRRLEPSVHECIGCGSCTATCSAGQYSDFNIRRLHTLLRRGETARAAEEIRKCLLCGKCQLVCPRGINMRNMILAISSVLQNTGS